MYTAEYATNRCNRRGKKVFRTFVLVACIASATFPTFAQRPEGRHVAPPESTYTGTVNFRVGSSLVLTDYMDNAATLEALGRFVTDPDNIGAIDRIVITAGASPEGGRIPNAQLARLRAAELKAYITGRWPRIRKVEFEVRSLGGDWDGLRLLVAKDPLVPHRGEVLDLLDRAGDNNLRTRLRRIDGGAAYDYIADRIFPRLRKATAVIEGREGGRPQAGGRNPYTTSTDERRTPSKDAGQISRQEADYFSRQGQVRTFTIPDRHRAARVRKPLLALKTNLLFDAATLLNIEAEVPLGDRYSVAGEWIFPWWLRESDQYAAQMGTATLEARRWLGRRSQVPVMTGWFVGVHGGGGYYDAEWKDAGHQGEFFLAGVSGGFAHTVSRNENWRMEYSLGLGYMGAHYRKYVPIMGSDGEWVLVRRGNGNYNWFGPTRARVSLVWILGPRVNGKGGAR